MNKTFRQKFHHLLQQQPTLKRANNSQQNLPQISLNQLQQKVNLFKKKRQQKQNLTDQATNNNNKEMNVCSPFYDRMKTHKPNCKCPYHRKQRLSQLPVRHSDKRLVYRVNQFHRNSSHEQEGANFVKHRNQSHLLKTSPNHLNKSIPDDLNHFSHTQPTGFQPKIQSRNYSYEQFLKECQFYLLKKNGFTSSKSNHIIRKGVKEIFQFINKHLHYTVDKMTEWVNSIEKDKDYGEFYIDRFKEMKVNFELNRKKKPHNSSLNNLFNRSQKLNSLKSKFINSNSSFAKPKQSRYKKRQNQSDQNSQTSSQSENTSSESESDDPETCLKQIVDQLKLNQKISEKKFSQIMNMKIGSFRQLFEILEKNIQNEKYKDQLLEKFDTGVLSQILKRYSKDDKQIKNIQAKLQIITKTQQFLKKYRQSNGNSAGRNSNDFASNSKAFITSKRNTQSGQNSKTNNSFHSKKIDRCSLQGSQANLKDFDGSIKEDENQFDEDGLKGRKKNTNNHGHNIRRSKLLKEEDFDLNFIRGSKIQSAESSDREFEIQRNGKETSKGFLTKAEKYLFDINMGKAIVNKEDSIFTAKRKVRVMKMLLKQNPNSTEANELQKYIKAIQHKVFLKTQSNKKMVKKPSSDYQMPDEEIWKLISLDNLGYNLIFYNLSSKINVEDNQDLCILLNEIKINGIKSFENNVTFKNHLVASEMVEEQKKNHKKTKTEDVFVQEGMGNMQFEPKIQTKSEKQVMNQTQKTRKTKRQNLAELKKMTETIKPNQCTQLNGDSDDLDENNMESQYQQVKKMLKYAKVHLPQTFDKYLKNSSLHSTIQASSFLVQ